MVAVAADLLTAELGFTSVTLAVNSLADGPVDKVLTSGPAGDSDLVLLLGLLTAVFILIFALVLLGWEARAQLAPLVTTAQANRISTVAGLALVTLAMDAHPDFLVNTFNGARGGLGPLSGNEFQSMLLEESLRALGGSLNRRRRTGGKASAGTRNARSRLGRFGGGGGKRLNWRR